MDDPSIKAILCATGGYGAVRMVDLLNFKQFKQTPKWVIGFSDITVLHSHLHQVVHMASLHSKMCGSFPKDWTTADEVQQASILSIKDALEGRKINYPSIPVEHNRLGTAKGVLIGGNIKILENLNGSASMINTDGKILFVEDNELRQLYKTDAIVHNNKMLNNHFYDAGFDISTPMPYSCAQGIVTKINFQVKCAAQMVCETGKQYPIGFYMYPRSSLSKTPLRLANSVGIIDAGYRGNIMAKVKNVSQKNTKVIEGEKLFQICSPTLEPIKIKIVRNLSSSSRGDDGFGSTGK
jgi:deoxyuridine 5'-triphosphate nucleotidohydrolase